MLRVPKELISRFVKLCPTCQVRRGAGRSSPPESEKSPEDYTQSPETASPISRRDSLATKRSSVTSHSPLSMAGFGSTFQQQNRWMTPIQPLETKYNPADTYPTSTMSSANYSTYENSSAVPHSTMGSSHNSTHYSRGLNQMSFSSSNTSSPTMGFPSSNVRSTNNWHTSQPGYGIKREQHY